MGMISIGDLPSESIQVILDSVESILSGKRFVFHFNSLILSDSSQTSILNSKIFDKAVHELGGNTYYDINSFDEGFDIVISTLADEKALESFVYSDTPLLKVSTAEENSLGAFVDLYNVKKSFGDASKIAVTGEISSEIANSFFTLAAKLGMELALISNSSKMPFEKYVAKARNYGIIRIYVSLDESPYSTYILYR